jgi:hypothetical protein
VPQPLQLRLAPNLEQRRTAQRRKLPSLRPEATDRCAPHHSCDGRYSRLVSCRSYQDFARAGVQRCRQTGRLSVVTRDAAAHGTRRTVAGRTRHGCLRGRGCVRDRLAIAPSTRTWFASALPRAKSVHPRRNQWILSRFGCTRHDSAASGTEITVSRAKSADPVLIRAHLARFHCIPTRNQHIRRAIRAPRRDSLRLRLMRRDRARLRTSEAARRVAPNVSA